MFSRTLASLVTGLAFVMPTANAAVLTFGVPVDGAQEVNASGTPNQGDPDGSGTAMLMIDNVANTIDWNITVNNIALPLTLAHIHQAPAGSNGSVVVDFNAQLTGSGLVDADLVNVLANPSGFYVNLHNASFPGGALRGQLPAAPVPAPPAAVLLLTAIAASLGRLRRR